MSQQLTISYECINAIGNSLKLSEMLDEVISTFIRLTGAVGGKYIVSVPSFKSIVCVGTDFEIQKKFTSKTDDFEIHTFENGTNLLDIPIDNGHFIFSYENQNNLKLFGNIFSSLRTKLTKAIDICRSVEKLHDMNKNLAKQLHEEKNKNEANEKVMIKQSRMAIMGEMIGMIAHQWRQPITVIGMITNNVIIDLQIDEFDPQRTLEELILIDKKIHYLSQTIDDFRHFFKPNKLPQKITIREISQELNTILGKSLDTHRISLSFIGDLDTSIVTYKSELLQVFLNILSNAKDAFIDNEIDEPKIIFNSIIEEGEVFFIVSDNACGIPPEHIDKIFEPYFSTKDEKHGTGLGLYMTAIIIEKHLGGNIRVRSDTNGTTFKIKIKTLGDTNNVY